MTPEEFARLVNANRYLLIKRASMTANYSQAEFAVTLTTIAIDSGFVQSRPVLKGSTLAQWGKRQQAPQWACRAAFSFLAIQKWIPETETERALYARYTLLNNLTSNTYNPESMSTWYDIAKRSKDYFNLEN